MEEKNENELELELQRQCAHEAWQRLDIQPPFPESLRSAQLLQLLNDSPKDALGASIEEKNTGHFWTWLPKSRLIYLAASFAIILGGLYVTGFGASFSKRLTSENTARSSAAAATAQNEPLMASTVNDAAARSATMSLPESIPQASQEEAAALRYGYTLSHETADSAFPATGGAQTPVPTAAESAATPQSSPFAYSPTEAVETEGPIDTDANVGVNISNANTPSETAHREKDAHKPQPMTETNATATENIDAAPETAPVSDFAADTLSLDAIRSTFPLCANLPVFDAGWELVYFVEQDPFLTLRLQQTNPSSASIDIHCSAADVQSLTALLSSQEIRQLLQGEAVLPEGKIPVIRLQDLSLAVVSSQFSANQNGVLRILYPDDTLLSFTFTNLTPKEAFAILSTSAS